MSGPSPEAIKPKDQAPEAAPMDVAGGIDERVGDAQNAKDRKLLAEMQTAMESADGKAVFEQARATLRPEPDLRLCDDAMKGPPPVDTERFGKQMIASTMLIITLVEELLREEGMSGPLVAMMRERMGKPSMLLNMKIQSGIEREEGARRPSGKMTPRFEARTKALVELFEATIMPEYLQAERQFDTNLRAVLAKEKKEGKQLMSAEEKREVEAGRGYMMEYVVREVADGMGVYRQMTDAGKSAKCPVTLAVEMPKAGAQDARPTLKLAQKPGKDAAQLMKKLQEILGRKLKGDARSGWTVEKMGMEDLRKILKVLQAA